MNFSSFSATSGRVDGLHRLPVLQHRLRVLRASHVPLLLARSVHLENLILAHDLEMLVPSDECQRAVRGIATASRSAENDRILPVVPEALDLQPEWLIAVLLPESREIL